MRREARQLELPLGIPLLQIGETELNGWQQGVAPSTIGRVLLRELRDRELRQRELAEAVELSRPQLTNVLRGRFGTAAATVGALKRVLSAWGLAACSPLRYTCNHATARRGELRVAATPKWGPP
jgi:predicted XRE-type DNA-binding protein